MNAEKLYLSQAGIAIEITFTPTEFVYLQETLIAQFKKVWGSFLVRSVGKSDFSIEVVPDEAKDNVFVREAGKKYYFLTFLRDFKHRKVTTYYSVGIRSLDMLLKEIFVALLEKDGFLLHCSSIKDRDGRLLVFLARSGGGKTTTANTLSGSGYTKFGDDIIIVRKLAGGWKFFSPPFIEKDRAPLKKEATSGTFYIVEKSKKPYLRKLDDRNKALPFLLGQIWLREKALSKKILANAILFLKSNDFHKLGTTLKKAEMRKIVK